MPLVHSPVTTAATDLPTCYHDIFDISVDSYCVLGFQNIFKPGAPRAWFIEITSVRMYVCVCVCVCPPPRP